MKLGNRVMPRHTWGTLNEQLDLTGPQPRAEAGDQCFHMPNGTTKESYRPTTARLTNPGCLLIICHPQMNNPQRKPACMQAKRITLTIFGGQGVMHLYTTLNLGFFTSTSTRDSSHRRSSLKGVQINDGSTLEATFLLAKAI